MIPLFFRMAQKLVCAYMYRATSPIKASLMYAVHAAQIIFYNMDASFNKLMLYMQLRNVFRRNSASLRS